MTIKQANVCSAKVGQEGQGILLNAMPLSVDLLVSLAPIHDIRGVFHSVRMGECAPRCH